jgi:hypothetical protein
MRAVSVLSVSEPAVWGELEAQVPGLAAYVTEALDERRRVVTPAFERQVLPGLRERVLVRYARREVPDEVREHRADEVAQLTHERRRVLRSAQRHALEGAVIGRQAWDPEHDAASVRWLVGAGMLMPASDDAPPYEGRYLIDPDLPPPPPVTYDMADAVMEETHDLPPASAGAVQLLHDMASLAAALEHTAAKATHAGPIALADARRIGGRLANDALRRSGRIEEDERWGRALRGLHALHVVSVDPLSRALHLDLGLEATLAGETEDATDRLIHRLLDADLHVVVPAVRAALRAAGEGAVDEVVFLELLREQHRDVLLPAWLRGGHKVYPMLEGEPPRPYDDVGFDAVEAGMVRAALAKMVRMGVLRRAPGVFAGTPDGRRWAGVRAGAHPPIFVTGDLELIVPPDALTVWERFQIERLSRCLQRDVVDRFRLERTSLGTWLATHEVEEALALLRRRCANIPAVVPDTLRAWAASVERVVLTRGVLLG